MTTGSLFHTKQRNRRDFIKKIEPVVTSYGISVLHANIRATITLTVVTEYELKEEARAMAKIALASHLNTNSIMAVSVIVI